MRLTEKIRRGWDVSAKGFSDLLQEDFREENRLAWLEVILEGQEGGAPPRILDVGTGPGFFAAILAGEGFSVTGIDISPMMLEQARENAEQYGSAPEFMLMDSEAPDFPEESFDLIVSRNVVWSLKNPGGAYAAWRRLLRPKGRLVVFDGDYLRDLRDPEFAAACGKTQKEYERIFGEKRKVSYASYEEARGWREELPLVGEERPAWDIRVLREIGYSGINCDAVNDRVFLDAKSRFAHRDQPLFRITAEKGGIKDWTV